MIPWMGYAVLFALLVSLAALLAESALRGRGRPGRWIWVGALVASLGVPAWAWLHPPAAPATPPPGAGADVPITFLSELQDAVLSSPSLLAGAEDAAGWIWLTVTSLLLVATLGGLWRLTARSRRWRPASVAGARVLLSDGFGPAVVGIRRPSVVLPRWSLGLAPEALRMVVLHEEEHRKAGDAQLLVGATLAVALAPWNPALWWQLRRLRAAVEVDCDARVLAHGVAPDAYGRLLLAVGARSMGLPLPLAALSRSPSLLERRLKMIVTDVRRGGFARGALALGCAALLVVMACEAPAPTAPRPAAEAEPTESAAAVAPTSEVAVKVNAMVRTALPDDGPLVFVDGVRLTEVPADLDADRIERIEVVKGAAARSIYGTDGERGVVHITTKAAGAARATSEGAAASEATFRSEQFPPDARIYVDGELWTGELHEIPKERIERIEVRGADQAGQGRSVHIWLKAGGGVIRR